MPILLTLQGLTAPIERAQRRLQQAVSLLDGSLDELIVHGVFALGVSMFETALLDLVSYYHKSIPHSIRKKDFTFSKEDLLSEKPIDLMVDQLIYKLSYQPLPQLVSYFCDVLSVENFATDEQMGNLIEIKETRNLLVHNDLRINKLYVAKSGAYCRSTDTKGQLPLSWEYAATSSKRMLAFINQAEAQLVTKYADYKNVRMLRNLWDYCFQAGSPLTDFDDFWVIREDEDRITHKRESPYEGDLSQSEKLFLGLWRAHFNGDAEYLQHFNMRRFDPCNRVRALHFLSVVDEIRFG